jgi:hypothetical protein
MANEVFVGSHEKSFTGGSKTGRGQNGDASPSSVYKAPAPIGKVSPPAVTVPSGDWQTRQLKGGNQNPDNVPTHPSMVLRGISDGSPGSAIGSSPARPVKK